MTMQQTFDAAGRLTKLSLATQGWHDPERKPRGER
jgi:hypothetical protein